jgi:opacity protein-like surface antigen
MLRRYVCVLAVAAAVGLSAPSIPASAAPPGVSAAGGDTLNAGLGHHGTRLRSGEANHSGGSGLRPGSGYGHTNSTHDLGSHQSGGWYQRGWGGTLNPGWGYNFGPNLGGPGH